MAKKQAAEEQKAAVNKAVSETQAEADAKYKSAMTKAEADKKRAVETEVKKAVAAAEKEWVAKQAEQASPEGEDKE